jgi:hypothetical protein
VSEAPVLVALDGRLKPAHGGERNENKKPGVATGLFRFSSAAAKPRRDHQHPPASFPFDAEHLEGGRCLNEVSS